MTLDEAIKHCEHVAEEKICQECADDHRQLAEWLRELKNKQSEKVIPISWIEDRIKWLKEQDFELAHLAAGIVQATLVEWQQEEAKKK